MTAQLGAHIDNARLIGEHALVRRGNGLLQLLELLIQLPIVHYLAGISYDHQGTGSNRGTAITVPAATAATFTGCPELLLAQINWRRCQPACTYPRVVTCRDDTQGYFNIFLLHRG